MWPWTWFTYLRYREAAKQALYVCITLNYLLIFINEQNQLIWVDYLFPITWLCYLCYRICVINSKVQVQLSKVIQWSQCMCKYICLKNFYLLLISLIGSFLVQGNPRSVVRNTDLNIQRGRSLVKIWIVYLIAF